MDPRTRFVPLPENRSAHQAVTRLAGAAARGADFPLLFLHGPPGSGKSHLAATLVESVAQGEPPRTAQTVAAAEIGRDLLQPPTERRAVAREAVGCDLLVIEDVQHLPPAAGDELAAILDRRQARRRATRARQVAMSVARAAGFSFPQIGAFFGRDHSTVMHSCAKVAELAKEDVGLARELRELGAVCR